MGEPYRCEWVAMEGGSHPKFGVHAGIDSGNKLYVARAHHEGAIVPGKLHISHSHVYIPYNMEEVPVFSYEVLIAPPASLSWVPATGGDIPDDAVVGGQDTDGETYYIGRVITSGTVTVGKVHASHGVCYVAYDGKELNFSEYEVLVRNVYGKFLNV
ncbi:unnamed protein product [Allacma fusca]|uniref:Uncharacterized protein n=1 Tax=Allacma fusca TaxID=39272 RepID=A0A8J2KEM3_9HEXA|nr:unnamed protein product [Allacma fusca]